MVRAKLVSSHVPLASWLDTMVGPAVLDYFQANGGSYFPLPGNSEPRMVESLPSATRDLNGNALVMEILPQDQPESDETFVEGDLNGDGFVHNSPASAASHRRAARAGLRC